VRVSRDIIKITPNGTDDRDFDTETYKYITSPGLSLPCTLIIS